MPGNAPRPRSRAVQRIRADRGARMLNYAIVALIIIIATLFVVPYLSPDLVRIEAAEVPLQQPGVAPGVAAPAPSAQPQPKLAKPDKDRRQINDFFIEAPIPTLTFDFEPEEWEYLKRDARRYAEAKMTDEKGKVIKGVAVKCKGSAGSFQGPEAKPGLTVSMNKYKGADRWRGFAKWHLNNGAQDGTYLMEQIAGEMARKAGVPASRCGHAFVKFHGRDLGLYVFKEAFDKDFLSCIFPNPEGDLYDGGFVADIRPEMEKDQGDRLNVANVKELIEACREGDQQKKWARVEKIVDVDKFISFLAMEAILCHWDGYNFNRNNYRVYFDADSGKAIFFLHGMDQTFGDTNAGIVRDSGAMVGQAVMSNPAWKALYRERVEKIYTEVLKPIDWAARVVEVGENVKAALALKNPQQAKDFQNRINEARDRVANRIAAVGKQLGDMPKPFKFDPNGLAKLSADGWRQEGGAAQIDGTVFEGKPCFHIRADGGSTASWRKPITLEPGKYRFEGKVRTTGVIPTEGGSGSGAGLRISGGTRSGENALKGDTSWKQVTFEFDAPGGDVVLVAELRATKGEVWFDREAFQLVRVR
ncbi:CotH kinase family protein [Verrucomicrobiota bacterium sgz303538]